MSLAFLFNAGDLPPLLPPHRELLKLLTQGLFLGNHTLDPKTYSTIQYSYLNYEVCQSAHM